jgi:hypothetical protein
VTYLLVQEGKIMESNRLEPRQSRFLTTWEVLYKYFIKPILHVIQYICGMSAFIGIVGMVYTFPVAILNIGFLIFTGTTTHIEYLQMFLGCLAVAVIGIAIMAGLAFMDDDFI